MYTNKKGCSSYMHFKTFDLCLEDALCPFYKISVPPWTASHRQSYLLTAAAGSQIFDTTHGQKGCLRKHPCAYKKVDYLYLYAEGCLIWGSSLQEVWDRLGACKEENKGFVDQAWPALTADCQAPWLKNRNLCVGLCHQLILAQKRAKVALVLFVCFFQELNQFQMTKSVLKVCKFVFPFEYNGPMYHVGSL